MSFAPTGVINSRWIAAGRPILCAIVLAIEGRAAPRISSFAGSGVAGFSGDGGPAVQSQLNDPTGIARGPDGALYICDTANHRIRKVSPDGTITTIAGTGEAGWSGDGGPGLAAKLHEPYEVRFDAAGNPFWVERLSHTVRKLDRETGIVTTVAGNGTAGFSGDGGPATKAQLSDPHSIGFDKAGDLYICDVRNHRIRKVTMKTGEISTFAGTGEKKPTPDGSRYANAPLFGPRALDFDAQGNLWVALREGNAVYKLDLAKGTIHHFGGSGKKGFTGDGGPAKQATLNGPKGLSVAPDGNVFIADTENHAIRMIEVKDGTIKLVAGTGLRGDDPDGDPVKCQLARPHGVFADKDGLLFIGDSEAHRVRVIRAAQTSSTAPRTFLLDARYLAATRQAIQAGEKRFAPALAELERDAGELLEAKPVSVMDKKTTPPSGDKHDYQSQAPYFWPNPATSNGLPYIRRDGERNPEINKLSDHGNILSMPGKVQTLALAYYFTSEEQFAAKAAEFLRVWFLAPATRMKPNFEYAQFVPGVNTGRGIGLIESRDLVKVVDAVGLLKGAKSWSDDDQRGLEEWFAEFLNWMRTSKHGRDEAAAKNNHGTYYDVQVVSFALFIGQKDFALEVLNAARTNRIAVQIEPDGRQPLELARTKAWSYSVANLSGLFSLATLGENVGVDLWHCETKDGRSLRKALDYLMPFGLRERDWPHEQLGGGAGEGFRPVLRQAAIHFSEAKYREAALRSSRTNATGWEILFRPPP